jgi:enoyl-CoA hydratase/carnithine racemase
MGSPLLASEDWLPQLAAVLRLQRDAGRRLFLIAATIESEADLRGVVDAARADKVLVVALRARADTVAARIADREPDTWPGKAALIEHARELAELAHTFAGIDLVIDTDAHDREEAVELILSALARWGIPTQTTS